MPSLHWIGKDKVINHHLEVPYRLLKKGYSFGEENSGNKIIRGDNLEALKALLPEYEGKIKCIYIDPPYNTGNEGWIYNDNVNDPKIKKWLGDVVGKEGEDLTRHDKWLCMMYPRLKLLYRLLSDDGVIFVSIDDNEQANLKLMLNEIFGGNNFIETLIWKKRATAPNDRIIGKNHEYIVVYSKNKIDVKLYLQPRTEELNSRYSNSDNDPKGLWVASDLSANGKGGRIVNSLIFPIVNPKNNLEYFPPTNKCWLYNKEKIDEYLGEGRIGFRESSGTPYLKRYLSEVRQGQTLATIIDNGGFSQDSAKEQKEIFGNDTFDFPKPSLLLEKLLNTGISDNDIVLDSFAGSGTTAHAVLNLNKQDGGNRKFILVEMEEYAETITAERVKRVIGGYGEKEGTRGGFDFFDLGPALLTTDGLLDDAASEEEIRAYICYTETALPLPTQNLINHKYWLTRTEDRDHYFYYERESMTILDRSFLSTIDEKMPYYTIWADQCHLSENVMKKHGITFRKIPRDIRNI